MFVSSESDYQCVHIGLYRRPFRITTARCRPALGRERHCQGRRRGRDWRQSAGGRRARVAGRGRPGSWPAVQQSSAVPRP